MRQILLLFLVITIAGCTREVVTIDRVLYDTLYISRARIDSIVRTDTAWCEIYIKGDTIVKETGKIKERLEFRIVHDTIYESRDKSAVVEVEKPTCNKDTQRTYTRKQWVIISVAYTILCGIIIGILYYIFTQTKIKSAIKLLLESIIRIK